MIEFISLLILVTIFVVVLLSYRKIKLAHIVLLRQDEKRDKALNNIYSQFEALQNLHRILPGDFSLPSLRGWAGSPDYLLHLAKSVIEVKPKNAVECGCGASTHVIAAAMKKNGLGHVYSFEHDEAYAERCRNSLALFDLSSWATVIYSPLKEQSVGGEVVTWYDKSRLPSVEIDLVNVDGPPAFLGEMSRYPAVPILINQLNNGAKIFLDDANRPSERKVIARWKNDFDLKACDSAPAEKGLGVFLYTK